MRSLDHIRPNYIVSIVILYMEGSSVNSLNAKDVIRSKLGDTQLAMTLQTHELERWNSRDHANC